MDSTEWLLALPLAVPMAVVRRALQGRVFTGDHRVVPERDVPSNELNAGGAA